MKVISGTLKGRVIPTQKTHDYRPTLSRIREDVFNLIQHNKELNINLENSTFGDLFCGTGSIGIEALSRGAQKVVFNAAEEAAWDYKGLDVVMIVPNPDGEGVVTIVSNYTTDGALIDQTETIFAKTVALWWDP